MARFLTTAGGQLRDRSQMVADPRLCQVARARATDMARRKYFAHVNPDGVAANALVRAAGYPLPSHYNTAPSGNNIESIGAGYANASAAWTGWMGSSGHKTHLLATNSFYRDQTTFGVGFCYDPSSPYGRYYVILTAPPAGDLLTITTPTSGSRVEASTVQVNGNVSGSGRVDRLVFRVENANGNSEWQDAPLPAGNGAGPWSATVSGLALGSNTIRAKTMKASGETVKEVARSVRMVVLTPLTVEIAGDGKLSAGFAGTSQRELGEPYTIRAIPKAGAIFGHWEGFADDATRDIYAATQTFTMTEGLALRAHFIPNPFPTRVGNYAGLLVNATGAYENTGAARLTLAANGTFSGHVTLGPARYRVRGTLNSAGIAKVELGQTGKFLAVQLDMASVTEFMVATIIDGTTEWSTQIDRRAPVQKGKKKTLRHTFRIDPDTARPESPQGFGYGTALVTGSNVVTFAGSLADGRKFSATGWLAANGRVELFASLFAGRGAFVAPLEIVDGRVTGTAHWFRPALTADPVSTAGFHAMNPVSGSLYVAPTGGNPHLTTPHSLAISGGNLSSALDQELTLNNVGRFAWNTLTIPGLKVRLQTSTGMVTGTFEHPLGGTRAFRGAMIQSENMVWGFFTGANEAGSVVLTPTVE